jgi:DNA-binding CsgD family transcriptional regulator
MPLSCSPVAGHDLIRQALQRWAEVQRLTPRELDLALELCAGRSNKAIARQLGIRATTVATELKLLFRRVNVHSRAEFVARCVQVILAVRDESDGSAFSESGPPLLRLAIKAE